MSTLSTPRTYGASGIVEDIPGGSTPYTIADLDRLRRTAKPAGPRIRFWAKDAMNNGLRLIEGTLVLQRIEITGTSGNLEYTVVGQMTPPITQQLVPDEISHDLMPVGTVEDDFVYSEIGMPEGFEPVGYIGHDDLKIETSVDYETRGRRTMKTSEHTTVEFSTCAVNHDLMARLMQP